VLAEIILVWNSDPSTLPRELEKYIASTGSSGGSRVPLRVVSFASTNSLLNRFNPRIGAKTEGLLYAGAAV
jgi:hypothetical protein